MFYQEVQHYNTDNITNYYSHKIAALSTASHSHITSPHGHSFSFPVCYLVQGDDIPVLAFVGLDVEPEVLFGTMEPLMEENTLVILFLAAVAVSDTTDDCLPLLLLVLLLVFVRKLVFIKLVTVGGFFNIELQSEALWLSFSCAIFASSTAFLSFV